MTYHSGEVQTKQELEEALTKYKISLNESECLIKHYDEKIKTVKKELEEILKEMTEKQKLPH